MKGKTSFKKKRRNSSGSTGGVIPLIFSFGFYDFTLTINFTDEDLKSNNIKFSEINELKHLKFISDKQEIIKKIELTTSNNTINELLLINKCSKKQCYVEYIPFSFPKFSDDEKFFEDILTTVIEKNYLTVNKEPIIDDCRFSLIVKIKYKSKEKTFKFGKTEEEEKNEKEEEEKKKKEEEEKKKKEEKEKKLKDDKKENKKKEKEEEKKKKKKKKIKKKKKKRMKKKKKKKK